MRDHDRLVVAWNVLVMVRIFRSAESSISSVSITLSLALWSGSDCAHQRAASRRQPQRDAIHRRWLAAFLVHLSRRKHPVDRLTHWPACLLRPRGWWLLQAVRIPSGSCGLDPDRECQGTWPNPSCGMMFPLASVAYVGFVCFGFVVERLCKGGKRCGWAQSPGPQHWSETRHVATTPAREEG